MRTQPPSNTISQQLLLKIQLNEQASFDEFCWGDNTLLQRQLMDLITKKSEDPLLYLWGSAACGKSHLLQACCHFINNSSAIYLPLKSLIEIGPEVLEGLDEQGIFCIDDIDAIAENRAWEEALFHLYNRIRDNGYGRIIISGTTPPAQTKIGLPDLRSRLSWGLVIQICALHDDDKIRTLSQHAKRRGFHLPTHVANYLITHCSRNMHDLQQLLNDLDQASLIAQRKLTIPFVKQVLHSHL